MNDIRDKRLKAFQDLIPLYESHSEVSRDHGKVYRNIASDMRHILGISPDTELEVSPDEEQKIREDERNKIARAISMFRNEHWQEHLRLHPYSDGRSCPRDYGIHDALNQAAKIALTPHIVPRSMIGDTFEGGEPVKFGLSWQTLMGRQRQLIEENNYANFQFSLPEVTCLHKDTQLRRMEIRKKYADPVYKHVEVCLVCGDEVREW